MPARPGVVVALGVPRTAPDLLHREVVVADVPVHEGFVARRGDDAEPGVGIVTIARPEVAGGGEEVARHPEVVGLLLESRRELRARRRVALAEKALDPFVEVGGEVEAQLPGELGGLRATACARLAG